MAIRSGFGFSAEGFTAAVSFGRSGGLGRSASFGGGAGSAFCGGAGSAFCGGVGSAFCGGVGSAFRGGSGASAVRRSGGGCGGCGGEGGAGSVLGAGGGSGAGLAVFSPFMIWLSCASETVSTGIASSPSSNFGADAKPRIRNSKRAP